MATYVLVGGAWMGGWCWQRVTPLLREAGHAVYPLTLTGLGEREHLNSPDVNLQTHIQDVVNVFEYEDLEDVILVGHSYSGLVVTGVADRIGGRIAHVVYVAAATPSDGDVMFDHLTEGELAPIQRYAEETGKDWLWPMLPELGTLGTGISSEDEAWMRSKAVPQSLNTIKQPVSLSDENTGGLPRTFIDCTREMPEGMEYTHPAKDDPAWGYYELPTGHWPMISMPKELAEILLRIR
jgi:pimeloyl-ACP methyl ester carboxylesterase